MWGRHKWTVVLLLLVAGTAAAGRAEAPRGDLQQRRLQPAPRPEFAAVRQAADALAATQEGPFRLHQVEVLFAATAPQGRWVWWTLVQHPVSGPRYEFLYLDAVTGTATSQCADQIGQGPRDADLVAVACPPPGAPATDAGAGRGRRR
jgi:hypothetical protein